MADPDIRNEVIALQILTASTPLMFWKGFQARAQSAYSDAYSAVMADTQLNDTQRLSKLYQERHFKMEWLLMDEARKHGIDASDRLIASNSCSYALAGSGPVQMTQKYVRDAGSMPSPAEFRKQLAASQDFHRNHGLMFGDEPQSLFIVKKINGIILHSPVGKSFDAQQQILGAIGFYIPHSDFSGWAVRLTFPQIFSNYAPELPQKDVVTPMVRRSAIKKAEGEE